MPHKKYLVPRAHPLQLLRSYRFFAKQVVHARYMYSLRGMASTKNIIRAEVSTYNRHELYQLSVGIELSTTLSNPGPPWRSGLTTARTRSTTSRRAWPKPAARTRMRGSTDTLTRLSTTKNHDINTLLPLTSLTDRQDRVTGRLRSKPSL